MELSSDKKQRLAYIAALLDLMAEKGVESLGDGDLSLYMRSGDQRAVAIPADGPEGFPTVTPDPLSDPVTFGTAGVPTLRSR